MARTSEAIGLINQLRDTIDVQAETASLESTRAQALHICQLLKSSLEQPEKIALETALLPTYTMCTRTAIHLGIFQILSERNGPMKLTELATQSQADHLLLARTLRMLDSMGAVKQISEEVYEATPVTKALGTPSMQAIHKHIGEQAGPSMSKFPQWLSEKGAKCPSDPRDGLLQFAFGTHLEAFEYWHSDPVTLSTFNTAMDAVNGAQLNWLTWFPVREQVFDGMKLDEDSVALVDVGGGRGQQLELFRKKCSSSPGRLILEELPAVVDDITQPLNPAIEIVKYDFFQQIQPVSGARAYFFSGVFHDWHDESCLKILRNTAAAMTKGYSKILICDMVLPETGCSFFQAALDITMMALHAGMERSKSQWTALLDQAGLKVVKFWMPPGEGRGIVEAVLK
ncbi:MAG: hypothetical protein Q9160_007890 [Pyrenula sp. 1 TL-2023]